MPILAISAPLFSSPICFPTPFRVLLLTGFVSTAQNKFTVNGYVKDSASGESIIGATIAIDGKTVTSNQYGFYSITMEEGEYEALVSHVSYLTQSFHISFAKNIQHTIYLTARSAALNEVSDPSMHTRIFAKPNER